MIKKLFLIVFIGIFLINSISALSIPTVTQNGTVELIQFCPSCTFVNLSSVIFPDNTIQYFNAEMTKNGSTYNFSFSNTAQVGDHVYFVEGDKDGTLTGESLPMLVTPFGTTLQNSGVVYGVLLFIFFFMDLIIFYIISRLDKDNFTDENGIFVGISIQKYLRVILIGVSYGLIVVTLNLMNATATTSSQVSQFSGIIGGIFSAMLSAAWVWTIIIVIWIAVMAWKDADFVNQMKKKLKELEEMH